MTIAILDSLPHITKFSLLTGSFLPTYKHTVISPILKTKQNKTKPLLPHFPFQLPPVYLCFKGAITLPCCISANSTAPLLLRPLPLDCAPVTRLRLLLSGQPEASRQLTVLDYQGHLESESPPLRFLLWRPRHWQLLRLFYWFFFNLPHLIHMSHGLFFPLWILCGQSRSVSHTCPAYTEFQVYVSSSLLHTSMWIATLNLKWP